jgi:hypothetical protein
MRKFNPIMSSPAPITLGFKCSMYKYILDIKHLSPGRARCHDSALCKPTGNICPLLIQGTNATLSNMHAYFQQILVEAGRLLDRRPRTHKADRTSSPIIFVKVNAGGEVMATARELYFGDWVYCSGIPLSPSYSILLASRAQYISSHQI